jgi:hypothetical protein
MSIRHQIPCIHYQCLVDDSEWIVIPVFFKVGTLKRKWPLPLCTWHPFCLSPKKGAVICGIMSGGRSIALQNIDKRNRVSIEENGAKPVAPLDSQPVSTIRRTSRKPFGLVRQKLLSVRFAICTERIAIERKYSHLSIQYSTIILYSHRSYPTRTLCKYTQDAVTQCCLCWMPTNAK